MKKKNIFLGIILLVISSVYLDAQVVISEDSTYVPISNNVLFEVHSANGNKGILIPRLTTAQRTSIPVSGLDEGLVVYDTTTQSFWVWDGSQWKELGDKQTLSYNSSTGELSISNGNTITLPTTSGGDNWGTQTVVTDGTTLSGDGTSSNPLSVVGDLTDDQNLSLSGNTLSIENGNSVDLSGYLDNTDDQQLSLSGHNLTIENGNTVTLPDNDNQTLSFNSSTNYLSISGGNSVDLSSLAGSSNSWNLSGNSVSTSNFLGTTNSNPLVFKVNNNFSGSITSSSLLLGYNVGNNITGDDNVFLGRASGGYFSSGTNNVAVGAASLYCYDGNPGGDYNVAIGKYAMFYPGNSNGNIAIGNLAFSLPGNGDYNVFIGHGSDRSTSGSVNNATALGAYTEITPGADGATAIGYRSYAAQSNSLILGQTTNDGNPNNASANTNVGINTIYPSVGANLTLGPMDATSEGGEIDFKESDGDTWIVDIYNNDFRIFSNENLINALLIFNYASGQVTDLYVDGTSYALNHVNSSDKRIKRNFKQISYGLSTVMKMQPLSYDLYISSFENGTLKLSNNKIHTIGFVAQDLYKIVPEAVHKPKDENKELWGISYETLVPVLVKAIQELKIENDNLKAQLKHYDEEINELKEMIKKN